MESRRILVVDDEETLCEALRFNLEAEGYAVDVALSAEEALTLDLSRYSLILLDIMMGDISGLQLAGIMKANPSLKSVPIIFCTAKDTEEDMIRGLDIGADDYIAKPYSLRTVLARIRAVMRRTSPAGTPAAGADILSFEGLTVEPSVKRCTVDGTEVALPRKEFETLRKLLSEPNRIFSREELLREIWTDEVTVVDRVIDVNITRIRHKIGRYGKRIITRSGYGYGFFTD